MNPDDHCIAPAPEDGGDEGFEALLRSLPVKELPAEWRTPVLSAAGALPGTAAAKAPLFSKPLTLFLAGSWSVIAILHFTAPDLPPSSSSGPPLTPAVPFPGAPFPDKPGAPWLAQHPPGYPADFHP